MVCTPHCNPYQVYNHRTNVLHSSLAPLQSGLPPTSQHPILRPHPHPGYSAPGPTTTYLNSRAICTSPQLLIQERPEAYKSIQAVVDDVEEKPIAERWLCVEAFGDIQGWGSDRKRVECQGMQEGEDWIDLVVAVFGIKLMGVLLLLSTWNRRSELKMI